MGLNMPARTVVFTSVRKWDGEAHRWMGSGEYIQMSGRAGRRGKDDRGVTVMMVDDKVDEDVCREMVKVRDISPWRYRSVRDRSRVSAGCAGGHACGNPGRPQGGYP